MRFRLLPSALVMMVLVLVSCGDDKPLTRFENTPPSILSLTATPDTVVLGDTALVVCEAFDPDPDHLTYSWWAEAGEFVSFLQNRHRIEWKAPMNIGAVSIRVTVSDQRDSTIGDVEIFVVETMGIVSGEVRDAESSAGIGSALVTIADRYGLTEGDGRYEIRHIPLGLQLITAEKTGYYTFEGLVEVSEEPVVFDVSLLRKPPATLLTGVVRDTTLSPLSGAVCRIASKADTTDSEGRYELADLPRGDNVLEVSHSGYQTFRQTIDLQEDEQTLDVILRAGAPDPPMNVRAVKDDNLGIVVQWDSPDASEGIAGFGLYKTENGIRSRLPGAIPAGTNQTAIDGTEDHRYFFEVVSIGPTGIESDPSPPSNILVLVRPSNLVSVSAGQFVMGNYPHGFGNDLHPGNPVDLGAFRIESLEVTNKQFLAFLLEADSAGRLRIASNPQHQDYGVWLQDLVLLRFVESRIDPDPVDGLRISAGWEDHPVVGVTWFGAKEYALHIGRRLPTEAEWEKAARGVTVSTGVFEQTEVGVGTRYPWGMEEPDGSRANFQNTLPLTQPVGSYPDGAAIHWSDSIYDMAGNVWEWCSDWYGEYSNPHTPPAGGSGKIVRGGGYSSASDELRCGHRYAWPPVTAGPRIGFRCAK